MSYYRWRVFDKDGHLCVRSEPKNLDTATIARNRAKKAADDYNAARASIDLRIDRL